MDDNINCIDTIDEKLAELKATVTVPDYSDLLSSFEWTREWFAKVEEVLLALAFRGEDDKVVLDFIRAKIRETDVRSFNKVLNTFGAPPIENHYDLIIKKKQNYVLLAYNSNDAIIDYILNMTKHEIDTTFLFGLSHNKNPRVIKFLIANPELIMWDNFCQHTSDLAVDFMLQNKDRLNGLSMSSNSNDKIVRYLLDNKHLIDFKLLSINSSNVAVDYLLANPAKIDYEVFSMNANDKAVRHLIQDPRLIEWIDFIRNPNDIAVDYTISNPDRIEWREFLRNKNPKATEYMFQRYRNIECYYVGINDNDIVVDTILKNVTPANAPLLSYHQNDKVLEYLMANKHQIIYSSIASNKCNYDRPKLREFNKLRVFPRLPHLQL